ncbi:MAG: dTDP-4-amino-4,6-dideoxygalactose transaminase [Burkholderiales bacterium]
MEVTPIPFNFPYLTGTELQHIMEAHANGQLAGDGPFTRRCHVWLEQRTGCPRALLTHSCTAALELAALLLGVGPGDEVIVPSYTFVSTANAFVLRGAVPVFVDVREDTLNLDESLIEAAITPRTRVIVPVHYAGVACQMDVIQQLAQKYGLFVVEDAAQAMMSTFQGRMLGSLSDLGAYSFHETKNVIAGEGGALLVNNPAFAARAEILREKGTDRSRFVRGEVDKYSWQEAGSSFLPGELIAAFLMAQLAKAEAITVRRLQIWQRYHEMLAPLEHHGRLRRPIIPPECQHNAHMYYVIIPADHVRQVVLERLKAEGVNAVSHYVPLHSSPAGRRYGRTLGELPVTSTLAERIIRLPMWQELTEAKQQKVCAALTRALA